jgi:hypothetical protein
MRGLPALLAAALALALTGVAAAAPPDPVTPDPDSLGRTTPEQVENGEESQFKFLAYFFTRAELTNIAPTNDLLQGRVVGRLFGTNTTNTAQGKSWLVEQRLIPFFIFEPKILDHLARLRASFEINWTWGDASYGVGANFGGGFSGRQINLETQNVEVEFSLGPRWQLDIGLQRLWDNVRNPYLTFFSTVERTGERLAFWGSDAVGVTLYGRQWGQLFKLGAYDLYHNKIQEDDHVLLFEALTDRDVRDGWHVGGSVRYLRDTSSGAGGVSVLGQGPDSPLADYNGVFRFPLMGAQYHANLAWLGLDTSYNPEFTAGRFGGSAFAVANLGQVSVREADGHFGRAAEVLGVALDGRAGFRYGKTRNDTITGEILYTSGDPNGIADGRYSGVITGNTWGTPGAPFVSSGAYLLLPHADVVNRFYAAAFDLSNQGYGLTAALVKASYDPVPDKLTLALGAAVGSANVAPPSGGHFMGTEVNASVVWRIRVFLAAEVHAAYLHLGNFYDSPREQPGMTGGRPADPWTAFVDLKWLMF